jgi:hypothetical protein
MCVKWGLEWDSDKADVHSVHFSVGIAIIGEIVSPNFKPKFKAIEHIMKRMELTFHNLSVILELVPSTVIFWRELSC